MSDKHAENTKKERERIKKKWTGVLANHDYTIVEDDLHGHGYEFHTNPTHGNKESILGTVAFWKVKGVDGVIIREVRHYGDSAESIKSKSTGRETDVSLVGNAYDYFIEKLGYIGPVLRVQEIIQINNKGYKATNLIEEGLEEILGNSKWIV
ncbi:MAG: hypothetical protein JSW73_02415 [Candidatus Woesearchaeota archaeon]|nr:MAG: hypothetical protein JSW73_02415 [Candidatus Woesearchaeota archaeon]